MVSVFQMGGRSNLQDEVLCRFIFPERPGALMKFLDSFSPRWNISLFHYRGQVGTENICLHRFPSEASLNKGVL